MGRQQYLERMALGRSAFEDPEPGLQHHPRQASDADDNGDAGYVQKYDAKGRPINPSAEERKRAMRHAQNAALELVGVVERKDSSERTDEIKYRYIRELREQVLKNEHDRGEDLGLLSTSMNFVGTWLPIALTARVGMGLYASSMSFSEIVTEEYGIATLAGIRNLATVLLPGAPLFAIHEIIRLFAYYGAGESIDYLQTRWSKAAKRDTIRRIRIGAPIACEILYIIVDLALLPLQYVAQTQRLELAPATPVLPYWRSVLPFGPASIAPVAWSSMLQAPLLLGALCSPAALLLLREFLKRNQDNDLPVVKPIGTFAYPPVNTPISAVEQPDHMREPVDSLLYKLYCLRAKALEWLGWNLRYITEHPRSAKEYENNRVALQTTSNHNGNDLLDSKDDLQHIYRSTSLSHWAANYIADCIDNLFIRVLIKIPFDTLIHRSIAQSYLASQLPKTTQAMAAIPHLYTPLGGGPLGQLIASGFSITAWKETGSFLSRLGLCLALQSTIQTATFFMIYPVVRWQGVCNFAWGATAITASPGRMDDVVYLPPGERAHPDNTRQSDRLPR